MPPELFQMSSELDQVNRLLDDVCLLTPVMERFYTRVGRPTIPTTTYCRMMYLKRCYKLGYEALVKKEGQSRLKALLSPLT